MGKGRAILSLIMNGFFFFFLPSMIFYGLTVISTLAPVTIEAVKQYLPSVMFQLYRIPVGTVEIPLGLQITMTSIIGLILTIIAMSSCLVQGTFTTGNVRLRKDKVLGGIKYLFAVGWTWLFFHQLSQFLITVDSTTITLLIHWQFYLIVGMVMFFFLAIANFFSATGTEEQKKEEGKEGLTIKK